MNNKWANTKSLIGKTVAITGATGGIGTELCRIFARLNANLILINRNQERSNKLKAELLNINPNINVEIYKTDLEDLGSVKQTA